MFSFFSVQKQVAACVLSHRTYVDELDGRGDLEWLQRLELELLVVLLDDGVVAQVDHAVVQLDVGAARAQVLLLLQIQVPLVRDELLHVVLAAVVESDEHAGRSTSKQSKSNLSRARGRHVARRHLHVEVAGEDSEVEVEAELLL